MWTLRICRVRLTSSRTFVLERTKIFWILVLWFGLVGTLRYRDCTLWIPCNFEPETPAFLNLFDSSICKGDILPLNYEPKVSSKLNLFVFLFLWVCVWAIPTLFPSYKIKWKGGDPTAGSPTVTLWRLNPPYWAWVRIHQKINPHSSPARLIWRAVCARHRDLFTGLWWNPITRNSGIMRASFSPQSKLR